MLIRLTPNEPGASVYLMANKTDSKTTIEAAFAIGRPARTAAHITCTRCKGTGWWQIGRLCFKCGGKGNAEKSTLATRIRDKRNHVAEVTASIVENKARLAKLGPDAPRWKRMSPEEWLARDEENLVRLESELAALEAQS